MGRMARRDDQMRGLKHTHTKEQITKNLHVVQGSCPPVKELALTMFICLDLMILQEICTKESMQMMDKVILHTKKMLSLIYNSKNLDIT